MHLLVIPWTYTRVTTYAFIRLMQRKNFLVSPEHSHHLSSGACFSCKSSSKNKTKKNQQFLQIWHSQIFVLKQICILGLQCCYRYCVKLYSFFFFFFKYFYFVSLPSVLNLFRPSVSLLFLSHAFVGRLINRPFPPHREFTKLIEHLVDLSCIYRKNLRSWRY